MAVIRIPKTPKTAYDPQRPAGTLLKSQLCHLEWAIRPAGARAGKSFQVKGKVTEAEAAARIAKLTAELHAQATSPRDVMPPNPVVPSQAPATPRSKSKSKSKPKTKRKSKPQSRSRRASRRRNSR